MDFMALLDESGGGAYTRLHAVNYPFELDLFILPL
jgi:hypothetical protein